MADEFKAEEFKAEDSMAYESMADEFKPKASRYMRRPELVYFANTLFYQLWSNLLNSLIGGLSVPLLANEYL